jgi:hypothetical protein
VTPLYHITVDGHLEEHWSAWFDGLAISHLGNGRTLLAGPLVDQAALYGVLIKIRDLGLPLVAVQTALLNAAAESNHSEDACHGDHGA